MNKLRRQENESMTEWVNRLDKRSKNNKRLRFMKKLNWKLILTWLSILGITYLIWSNIFNLIF